MAVNRTAENIQVVNVDLAEQRQRILREKLQEFFRGLSKKSKVQKELIYVGNINGEGLEKVAAANPQADAVFTGFNFEARVSEDYKQDQMVASEADLANVPPGTRYPLIGDFENVAGRGYFRHRRLFLVGEVEQRLKEAVKSGLVLEVSFFSNSDRNEVSQPVRVTSPEMIHPHREGSHSTPDHIIVSEIHSLTIAGIPFAGVVNMPERDNRFVLEDLTLFDTTSKLFSMEGVKEVMIRESLQEEQRTFVRSKKVFIVMDSDLEYVVSERLVFDKMERLYRHHNLADALAALENGKSQGMLEYFEAEGFGVAFEDFSQEERDAFMLAMLGPRLGEVLEQEIQNQKNDLSVLEDGEVSQILNGLPESVLNGVLDQLRNKSTEKYLALVPLKTRESAMQGFLSDPGHAKTAWLGMGEQERKDILNAQAPAILAHLYLVDTPLYQKKFSTIAFEFEKNYHSSSLAKLDPEQRKATRGLLLKGLKQAKPPPGILAKQLSEKEQAELLSGYVTGDVENFVSLLNPLSRKNLWNRVGGEFHDQITATLHFLDKVEIMRGNRESALQILFDSTDFLAALKGEGNQSLARRLFLILKKNNKVQSKTALLRKILADDGAKAERDKQILGFFSDPENQSAAAKVDERMEEEFNFFFDSLICTAADLEELKDREPLRDATVTLIDDLVDSSLFNLFQREGISREDYDTFSVQVEQEIEALREKISRKEGEDPVSVYLLESMNMLNQMTNQAMQGNLDADAVEKIDERRAVRERMIATIKEHLEKVGHFLAKAGEQERRIEEKIGKAAAMAETQRGVLDGALQKAREAKEGLKVVIGKRDRALVDKRKVAMTQKELSLQFFYIIQPLVLKKVRSGAGWIKSVLRRLGLFKKESEAMARRIIFQFTDAEIENILQNRIVFCSKDEILVQFILTCLRIDGLQDSLFSMATPKTLPAGKIDILFYGPGYEARDFKRLVSRKNIVPFADQPFIDRLTENEKLKAATKTEMAGTEKELESKKPPLQKAAETARAHKAKLQQIENAHAKFTVDGQNLAEKVQQQRDREHHFEGELHLLETRFAEVDGKFNFIRETLAEVAGHGGAEAMSLLTSGRESLAEKLQGEMMALNKEMARMMYIKGVKDAGGEISQGAQQAIMGRMEQREKLPSSLLPIKKVVVADDGSPSGRNLKRVFAQVASAYFKLSEGALEEISLKRLESRAEDPDPPPYPFVVLLADANGGDFGELKNLVKKIRARMPETYQMVFAPFGEIWNLDPSQDRYKNLQVLKENSCLVNAAIADYTDPQSMARLLSDKAPRK